MVIVLTILIPVPLVPEAGEVAVVRSIVNTEAEGVVCACRHARTVLAQYKELLWRWNIVYWRSPQVCCTRSRIDTVRIAFMSM